MENFGVPSNEYKSSSKFDTKRMASSIRRGGANVRRRDVKQRTMNRFVALDGDIASRYDGYDEDEERLPISQHSRLENRVEVMNRDVRGRGRIFNQQIKRSAGGRRDIVYRVTIRNGGKGDPDYIMRSLSELTDNILPFNIGEDANKNVIFYVYTHEEAENIKVLNRRISHPSDPRNKFMIYHASQPAAWESLDQKIKTAIRDVVKSRFNPASNSIDLTEFQSSKIFLERDLRSLCSLTRNAVLVETIRAVAELFPNITGLSLKNNRLAMLNYIQSFTYACPAVVELDLSDNNLDTVEELRKLRQWGIERLYLENNPMCSAFSDASSYTSAVQDFLPHVTFLDGTIVNSNPSKVKADLQRRSGILHPPVQASYFPDKALRQRVEQLLLQFYELYDGRPSDKSRQMLVNAYDEDAVFTHAIYTLRDHDSRSIRRGDDEAYGQYIRSSHNLCQEDKWERYREKITYKGAMAIAVAVSQLPTTEHDKSSFLLEFLTVRQNILVFTLRGILRDGSDVDNPSGAIKFFTRTFVVVPRGEDKMAIVNDDLILTPISQERHEKYTEQLKKMVEVPDDPQPGPSGLINNSIPLGTININGGPSTSGLQEELRQRQEQIQQQQAVPYDRNDPEIRKSMTEAFSQQSGMKLEWAEKCLTDTNWDYEAAGKIFNEMRQMIPPEAFM